MSMLSIYAWVFDAHAWNKEGDVGDNSKFWKLATIDREYVNGNGDVLVDVTFQDGSISSGHFKSGVKFIV